MRLDSAKRKKNDRSVTEEATLSQENLALCRLELVEFVHPTDE